jgi:hypothetical protein
MQGRKLNLIKKDFFMSKNTSTGACKVELGIDVMRYNQKAAD